MLSGIIWYLIVGVAFNFLWDLLINSTEMENYRFTNVERFTVILIWPIALLFFVGMFIKTFLFGDNNDNQ